MMKYINNIEKPELLNYAKNPPFGKVHIPVVLWGDVSKKEPIPNKMYIDPLKNFNISPFSSALHYGQSIFEGLKAYQIKDGKIGIFRLNDHAKRFVRSANIMSMLELSDGFFTETLEKYVSICRNYIPKEDGHSLYLRPLLFAADPIIKVRSSDTFKYVIMSSIVGDYFENSVGQNKSKVLVSKKFSRAFPGGTGEAKTAANYALSLSALDYAMKLDYQQVLYLDALTHTHFEELGGMNFFWVKNGALYTPKLNGQILHGVTRASVLEIAASLGMKVYETELYLTELLQGHQDKTITEVFATGTAALVTPLGEIGVESDHGEVKKLIFEETKIADSIKKVLMQAQSGQSEFSKRWLTIIQ